MLDIQTFQIVLTTWAEVSSSNIYYMFWILLVLLVVIFQLDPASTRNLAGSYSSSGGTYDAAEKLGINARRIRILAFVSERSPGSICWNPGHIPGWNRQPLYGCRSAHGCHHCLYHWRRIIDWWSRFHRWRIFRNGIHGFDVQCISTCTAIPPAMAVHPGGYYPV